MEGIIYIATNKLNGKKYVGQTIKGLTVRKYEHEYSSFKEDRIDYNVPFHLAIRKYGESSFTWEIACSVYGEKAEVISKLNVLENLLIVELNTLVDNGKGYNCTLGGGSTSLSEQTKAKISKANKGKNNGMYGTKGDKCPSYGKKLSDTTKKKLSDTRKGKKHSEETKDKISKAELGDKNGNAKPVKVYKYNKNGNEFVGEFTCIKYFIEYAKSTFGIDVINTGLSNVLKGKRNHHKGFYLEYAN